MPAGKRVGDWLLRFVKGLFIGSGFILPGVSGGALAAVFGVYERMIAFIAHPARDFLANLVFFLPVGLGALSGVFLLSFAVSFFLGAYEAQILWFFIGCILGTLPSLWRQAGKHGRTPAHIVILAASAVLGYYLLALGERSVGGAVPQTGAAWLAAGGIIGLGVIVPGLSPSNFLVYMGLYKPLADGIKTFDLPVILPVFFGAAVCVLALSRLMNHIFSRAYGGLFHFILGVVAASTLMIVPRDLDYLSAGALVCLAACVGGVLLGAFMSGLEDRHKPQ